MSLTFAGCRGSVGHTMALGLPYTAWSQKQPPLGYIIQGVDCGELYPAAFPLTAIGFAHWKVKTWKVSASITDLLGSGTETWTNVVLDPNAGTYLYDGVNRPADRVDLCRPANNGWNDGSVDRNGVLQGGDAESDGLYSFISLMLGGRRRSVGSFTTAHHRDLWIESGSIFRPALSIEIGLAISGPGVFAGSGYPSEELVGYAQMLGVSIPIYGLASEIGISSLVIEPYELYDYTTPP